MEKIANIDDLIYQYYKKNPNGHFFDYDTLKWFGESRSRMRLLKGTTFITKWNGEKVECYIISKYSAKYPGGGRTTYAYFDVNTLEDVPAH